MHRRNVAISLAGIVFLLVLSSITTSFLMTTRTMRRSVGGVGDGDGGDGWEEVPSCGNLTFATTDSRRTREAGIQRAAAERLRREAHASVPEWVREQIRFQREKRRELRERRNAESTAALARSGGDDGIKYLVYRCMAFDVCGGFSDRIGVLPYLYLLAHETKRVLLFHWEKPTPLTEFFVPPSSEFVIDWTLTDTFLEFNKTSLRTNKTGYQTDDIHFDGFCKKMRYQGDKEWCHNKLISDPFYVNQTVITIASKGGGVISQLAQIVNKKLLDFTGHAIKLKNASTEKYDELFRHLFWLTFAPSPALEDEIQAARNRLGLPLPWWSARESCGRDYYGAAHVRARLIAAGRSSVLDRVGGLDVKDGEARSARVLSVTDDALRCAGRLLDSTREDGDESTAARRSGNRSSASAHSLSPRLRRDQDRHNGGKPIYLASDTISVSSYFCNFTFIGGRVGRNSVRGDDEKSSHYKVVARADADEPLHIDNSEYVGFPIERFFGIFVDLYLMMGARVISNTDGGFGNLPKRLASVERTWNVIEDNCSSLML